ncbi:hypothetical protein [Hirschia litorea]|uniref:Uncharacterized protein n=1 Tax=Hirschia litorea TaxID=1199156 RepID=A0ABW2IKD6_9PROT
MLKYAKRFSASLLVLAALSSAPSNAQIVSSGSLTEVDPWGVGWKSSNTGGLGSNLWSATNASSVYELLGSIDANQLTPAQANLLRAIVLSGGKAPAGSIDEATTERLRLLRELGETKNATNLLQRFPNESWSEDPRKFEADMDFATGDNKRACATVDAAPSDDSFWQSLRATCFALAGNATAANLSAEMAVSSGEEDPWLFEAVSAVAEVIAGNENTKLPAANYSTGATIALSLAAKLPPEADSVTSLTPQYAAFLAQRADAPEDIRKEALLYAARAGVIDAQTARKALISPKPTAPTPDPNLPADKQVSAESDIMRTPLERAVDSVTNPDIELKDKAVKLIAALVPARGNAQEFALHAKVLLPELKSIPQTRETAPLSPAFVEAALAAEDLALAQRWRDTMNNPFDDPPPAPIQAPNTGLTPTIPAQPQTGSTAIAPAGQPINLAQSAGQPLTLDEQLQALNNAQNSGQNSTANAGQSPPNGPMTLAPAPKLQPILHSDWDKARLDALILLANPKKDNKTSAKVVSNLVIMAETHPIEANRYLSILSGIGYLMSPDARDIIAKYQNTAPSLEQVLADYKMANARRDNAVGEASLRALITLRDTTPQDGDLIPYTNALSTLGQNGLTNNAKAIALEALAPWAQKQSNNN